MKAPKKVLLARRNTKTIKSRNIPRSILLLPTIRLNAFYSVRGRLFFGRLLLIRKTFSKTFFDLGFDGMDTDNIEFQYNVGIPILKLFFVLVFLVNFLFF